MQEIQQIGKYEVIEEISRGSMGIVYLGHDPFVDRPVAIKVSISDALEDDDSGERQRKMFFNEAHTAGRLTHPNIVGIFDAGAEGETLYIVMEYVPGGRTLKDYTRGESLLPVDKVVEIMFKCARALDYAHKQGVVHRDIKPSNILITPDLDVKLADFSIAQVIRYDATVTVPMGMVGSPRYMSPEQINEDYVTHQSDLFSLGILMFELLTGRYPFQAEGFSRLIQKILHEPPPPLAELRPDLPPALITIVGRLLQKDVADRYASALALAADLNAAFDAELHQSEEEIVEQERFNLVRETRFFSQFPEVELWEILRGSHWLAHQAEDEIIVEGDIDDSFYIIISGQVDVVKGGRRLRTLAAGDCFGEMGYLTKTRRIASIIAREETALLKLNSTVVGQVSMECQVRFLKIFLRTLIHRLSATSEVIAQAGAS